MDQKKIVEFLAFWVVNTLVLLVSSLIFSGNVVLGNSNLSVAHAAIVCGLIITVFGYLVPTVVKKTGYSIKNENIWGAIYFGANAVIVWVIKRFALILGFGVSSILFVVLVAVLLTVAQWAAAIATGAMKKAKK